MNWTTQDMPSQHGRIAIVTGANRGLGLLIAKALAGAGAQVILAGRRLDAVQAACADIRSSVAGAQVEAERLDLADLASIRTFVSRYRHTQLDLLCNNASAIMVPKGHTVDGFETHFGTNHLGPFALTGLLMEPLLAAPAARIVNTASLAHRLTPGLDLDDPNFEHRAYKEMDAYGASKLATLLFTFELDRRLRACGAKAISVAAHPGYAATNLDIGSFLMRLSTRLFAQAPAMGALPALYAASAADVQGGDYYGPGGFKELKGPPIKVDCRPEARDVSLAQRLWALSEQATGVHY